MSGGFWSKYWVPPDFAEIGKMQGNISGLTRLEPIDCFDALTQHFNTDYRNVLLVTNTSSKDDSILNAFGYQFGVRGPPYAWTCAGDLQTEASYCNETDVRRIENRITQNQSWTMPTIPTPEDFKATTVPRPLTDVQYCLAQPSNAVCSVNLERALLITVIACNAVKVLCFILTLIVASLHQLITVGDALKSFSKNPDPVTKVAGPLSYLDVPHARWGVQSFNKLQPKEWNGLRPRWFQAAGYPRWIVAIIL